MYLSYCLSWRSRSSVCCVWGTALPVLSPCYPSASQRWSGSLFPLASHVSSELLHFTSCAAPRQSLYLFCKKCHIQNFDILGWHRGISSTRKLSPKQDYYHFWHLETLQVACQSFLWLQNPFPIFWRVMERKAGVGVPRREVAEIPKGSHYITPLWMGPGLISCISNCYISPRQSQQCLHEEFVLSPFWPQAGRQPSLGRRIWTVHKPQAAQGHTLATPN